MWLTGLPASGKSTLASAVAARLSAAGRPVEVLDGDELRRSLSADLGFSPADRATHVRRVGFVAALLAGHGVVVLVPVIAPQAETRDEVRARHEAAGVRYLEVHVATPVEVCARRDPKGLYARAAAGELPGLTGVDASYDAPEYPELRLDTTGLTVAAAADRIWRLLPDAG